MNHDEYEKFEGKKNIKELKQLWLHARLFCELEDRIDILIRRVLIVLKMWKIFFWNN